MRDIERVRKLVHDAIVKTNCDVDPYTQNYFLAVTDEKIVLCMRVETEFTSLGEFRVEYIHPKAST